MDAFWQIIDEQLTRLRSAGSADDVMAILSTRGSKGDKGFFGGGGGDTGVDDALAEAGWSYAWSVAGYHWAMLAPDGTGITYVEGDVFRGVERPLR